MIYDPLTRLKYEEHAMRRRRNSGFNEIRASQANDTVRKLMLNVIAATAPVTFTRDDVLEAIVDPVALKAIREASKYAETNNWRSYVVKTVLGKGLRITCEEYACIPRTEYVFPQPSFKSIEEQLLPIIAIQVQFTKVTNVVNWLAEEASMSAVRYYWPTMLSLLPAEHDIHKCAGRKYQEPRGISEMIPLFRETSATVAGALLCPQKEPMGTKLLVAFDNIPLVWAKE